MKSLRREVGTLRLPMARRLNSQRGSVVIEFAFILPVFLALLFGVISFSIALYNQTILTMAARQGARAGSLYVEGRDDDSISSSAVAAAMQVCEQSLISFGPAMSPTITPVISGDILTVTASGVYTGFFVISDLPLSAQTSMRIEEP